MIVTTAEIRAALLNYYKPLRTPDAKVKDTLDHVKISTTTNPGGQAGADGDLTSCEITEGRCRDES